MTLQNQLCTSDQAKKLKELGVYQVAFFFFDRNGNTYIQHPSLYEPPHKMRLHDGTKHNGTTVGEFFTAFTVAELMQALGAYAEPYALDENIALREYGEKYRWANPSPKGLAVGFNLASVLSDALIAYLEYGALTASRVNSSLSSI